MVVAALDDRDAAGDEDVEKRLDGLADPVERRHEGQAVPRADDGVERLRELARQLAEIGHPELGRMGPLGLGVATGLLDHGRRKVAPDHVHAPSGEHAAMVAGPAGAVQDPPRGDVAEDPLEERRLVGEPLLPVDHEVVVGLKGVERLRVAHAAHLLPQGQGDSRIGL